MSRETRYGWAGSLAFHAVLTILFILLTVPQIVANPEFIELTWGVGMSPGGGVQMGSEPSPSSSGGRAGDVVVPQSTQKPAQPVELPERRFPDMGDEAIGIPRSQKQQVPQTGAAQARVPSGGVGEKEQGLGKGVGEREAFSTASGAGVSPSGVATPGSGGVGRGSGPGVGYSVQWMAGGNRKMVSGELPEYPSGTNVEAQIKILAVVQPDGAIKTVQPVQKANTRLEDAAMRAVRQWRFEPLRSGQSQLDQNCVITFLFKLK